MAVLLLADFYEQILIKLDVEDLIRCKSVCKSWYSLISGIGFIKKHLKYSYNSDQHGTNYKKNEILHRRIVMTYLPVTQFQFGSSSWFFSSPRDYYLVGSSNGLICFAIANTHLVLANPVTRQVKELGNRPQCPSTRDIKEVRSRPFILNSRYRLALSFLCWGFGYDSVMDDYKVLVGFMKSDYVTCFHVLSLKSNVWKFVGQVKYCHFSSIGVLCKGALHWLMLDVNENMVILSFDLSENKFKEIMQPDNDVTYQSFIRHSPNPMLGTIEECLCIYDLEWHLKNLWKMNDYNVKGSWETVGHDDWENKNDVVHWLQEPKHGSLYDELLCHDVHKLRTIDIIGAHVFVQSLVSPNVHDHGKHKRKMQSISRKKGVKLIKGDSDSAIPGVSERILTRMKLPGFLLGS